MSRGVEVVPVRRADGNVRWLTGLGREEAAGYANAVKPLTPMIERTLGPEVMANRALGRGARLEARLEPWRPARIAWRRALETASGTWPLQAVLVADVRHCYASIRPMVLAARLRALGADPAELRRLEVLLERFGEEGVRGLPIGPAPSAILANAVLAEVDERLRRSGTPHLRWVDDVVAFAASRHQAMAAFDALRRGLDAVGLAPNDSKTRILTDRERVREHLLGQHPPGSPSTGGASAVG